MKDIIKERIEFNDIEIIENRINNIKSWFLEDKIYKFLVKLIEKKKGRKEDNRNKEYQD